MPTVADRATEFHRLIEQEATLVRNVRLLGYEPTEEAQQASAARRTRLDELTVLLGGPDADAQPDGYRPWDVEYRIDRWITTHPLAMTGTGMKRIIDQTTNKGNGNAVFVQIGDPSHGGRHYPLHEGMFTHEHGTLLLTLPDSIAEEFRQQGRRAVQRETARALGYSTVF